MPFETIFLDAGGVLVSPETGRGSAMRCARIRLKSTPALSPPPIRRPEIARRRRRVIRGRGRPAPQLELLRARADERRGDTFPAAEAALASVHDYQRTSNIWEHVPDFVPPALQTLRSRGHKLVVVSNSNGTVRESSADWAWPGWSTSSWIPPRRVSRGRGRR